jgi:putative transposase
VVWHSPSNRLLPPDEVGPQGSGAIAGQIKALIEERPSFGYRTVAHLLDFNKNAVQRIFQLKH